MKKIKLELNPMIAKIIIDAYAEKCAESITDLRKQLSDQLIELQKEKEEK